MTAVILAPESVEAVARRVVEMQRDSLLAPKPQKISVTVAELQVMLAAPSRWATQQQIKRLKIKPYSRGLYRLRDVENAIARRTRA